MPTVTGPTTTIPGLQRSALDIIKRALRALNVLASGESPSGDEANDALVSLNQMIDGWQTERLMIFTVNIAGPFNLQASKQTYTLGTGGDFNISRPAEVMGGNIVIQTSSNQPLEVPLEWLTDAEWKAIPVKNVPGTFPMKCYDDGSFPSRNLSFWPVPTTAPQLYLYCWNQLSYFKDLATQYTFPPAYQEAIWSNLAMTLAAEYPGSSATGPLQAIAVSSKAKIKTINSGPQDLRCDPAIASGANGFFNYYTGENQR